MQVDQNWSRLASFWPLCGADRDPIAREVARMRQRAVTQTTRTRLPDEAASVLDEPRKGRRFEPLPVLPKLVVIALSAHPITSSASALFTKRADGAATKRRATVARPW